MKTLILAGFLAGFFVSGCAALTEGNADAKLVTQYAVLKVADNSPEKAARIAEIATEVKQYAGSETLITVELLVEAIRAEIRWETLDAADVLLVSTLLEKLRSELTGRLGADVLPEDVRLAADVVATWVLEAAQLVQ